MECGADFVFGGLPADAVHVDGWERSIVFNVGVALVCVDEALRGVSSRARDGS